MLVASPYLPLEEEQFIAVLQVFYDFKCCSDNAIKVLKELMFGNLPYFPNIKKVKENSIDTMFLQEITNLCAVGSNLYYSIQIVKENSLIIIKKSTIPF
jgi:hypothetical protein